MLGLVEIGLSVPQWVIPNILSRATAPPVHVQHVCGRFEKHIERAVRLRSLKAMLVPNVDEFVGCCCRVLVYGRSIECKNRNLNGPQQHNLVMHYSSGLHNPAHVELPCHNLCATPAYSSARSWRGRPKCFTLHRQAMIAFGAQTMHMLIPTLMAYVWHTPRCWRSPATSTMA